MCDGRVYYRTRGGVYKQVNAPGCGRMQTAVINPGVVQGERAASLYAESDPQMAALYADTQGSSPTTVDLVGPETFRQLVAASRGAGF